MNFVHLRKDSIGSLLVIILVVAAYSWLVFDIASSFGGADEKNKEIFFLAMLPILVGIILKGFDRLIGRFFHTNSSDAEKGELALSLLQRFENLIRVYLSSSDQSSKKLVHREAACCAKLIAELHDSMYCPFQKKGLLVCVRAVFPTLVAESFDLSELRVFDLWCGEKGAIEKAMSESLSSAQKGSS